MTLESREPATAGRAEPVLGAPDPAGLRPLSDVLDDELIWNLLDAAPDAMVIADETGRLLLVNRQTEELFGYERTELLGKSIEELVPERFRQVHRAHRTRYRAEPRTRPMGTGSELFGRRSDGTEFPVEISLSPLGGPSGVLVVASVRDITARVEAEAEQRQIRDLLDSTRDAIFIFDADTLRFTYVNEGAVEQVGYARDELVGMTMLHLAPDYTGSELREVLEPLARGDVSATMLTTVHRRRDGVDLPVEIVLQAGAAETGAPRAFVMLVRDIHERVEAEARLREAGEELRLLEDRERIARDLHDNVIQRIFAAGMSLQSVSAMVSGLDAAAAHRIDQTIDELDETIRDIRGAIYGLQASATSRGGLRREILRVIDEERSALGTEPHLRFEGVVDAVPDDVAEHLLAALREALSNVARHAQATHVTVVVEAGDHVVLRVVDDGVGLPVEPGSGNGVRNMGDRAARLDGTFRAVRGDDSGTVVEWRVPNRSG